jgi:hypothetical protein
MPAVSHPAGQAALGGGKTKMLTRKIWINVGVAIVAPAAAAAPMSISHVEQGRNRILLQRIGKDHPMGQTRVVGGETYLRDGGISDTRTRFSRDMLLLQGHGLIADEAVASGDWTTALMHLTTSTEDLRKKLEPYMKGQGIASFSRIVADLTTAVGSKDMTAYLAARRAFQDHEKRASLAIRKFQDPYVKFQMRAAVETLKAASSAYDAAVSEQHISDPSEYRDSRGFILAAERAIHALHGELAKVDVNRLQEIDAALTELRTAWPTPSIPTTIALSVDGVAVLVSRIEELAEVFWQ